MAQRCESGVLQGEERPRDRGEDVQQRERRMRPQEPEIVREGRRDQNQGSRSERRRSGGDAVRHEHRAGRTASLRR